MVKDGRGMDTIKDLIVMIAASMTFLFWITYVEVERSMRTDIQVLQKKVSVLQMKTSGLNTRDFEYPIGVSKP